MVGTPSSPPPPPGSAEARSRTTVKHTARKSVQPGSLPPVPAPPEPPRGGTPPPPPKLTKEDDTDDLPTQVRRPDEMPVLPSLDPAGGQNARAPSVRPPAVGASSAAIPPPARSGSVPPPSIPPPPRAGSLGIPTEPPQRSTTLSSLSRVGDAMRDHLPEALRSRLERVPGAVLLGASATLAALVLVGLGIGASSLLRSGPQSEKASASERGGTTQSDTPAEPAPSTPAEPAVPDEKPATAKKEVSRDEPALLLSLADSLLTQRRDAEVPSLIERLVARHPELKQDKHVAQLLLTTAASNDRRAAADSYTLLTGAMGETGAALMYELSFHGDAREGVRQRAQNWLASKEFERTAALPVYAAVKLRNAKSCEDKRALLDFAGKAGGTLVLEYLHELDQKTLCAPNDLEHCYPCMRGDSTLKDTIAKLEKP